MTNSKSPSSLSKTSSKDGEKTNKAPTTDLPTNASLTERIHKEAVQWVLDPSVSPQAKVEGAFKMAPPTEGAVEMTVASRMSLSPGLDWNGHFRKAYSLLIWMKPEIQKSTSDRHLWRQAQEGQEACLYRLEHVDGARKGGGNSPTEADSKQQWIGVEVSMGPWQMDREGNYVQTWVKATPLGGGPCVQINMELPTGQWSLVGINHIFPYLKRPQWTLCVNGQGFGGGELNYPLLDYSKSPNATMEFTVGGWCGGCTSWGLYNEPIPPEAQALVAEAGPSLSNCQQPGLVVPRVPPIANYSKGYSLDGRSKVGCCLLVHPLAQSLQPLVDAHVVGWGFRNGPRTSETLGSAGTNSKQRFTWNLGKCAGRTKDVPRVGLIQPQPPHREPFWTLTVYDATLEFSHHSAFQQTPPYQLRQELARAQQQTTQLPSHEPVGDGANLRLALLDLGLHRWIMPFFLSFPVTFLLEDNVQARLQRHSLQHLWSLLYEVPLPSEDAFTYGVPKELWGRLRRQNNNAGNESKESEKKSDATTQEPPKVCLAAILMHVLAEWVTHGGARVHEEILQEGCLHMLTVCLRWALLRAEFFDLYNTDTMEKFTRKPKDSAKHQEEDLWMQQVQQGQRRHRPKKIPGSVARAAAHLLDACFFGTVVVTPQVNPWASHLLQLRMTGDLALTALFGFGLDFDLWGGTQCENSVRVWKVIARAYGGCNLEAGTVVRSQISVQFLLDQVRLSIDQEHQQQQQQLQQQQQQQKPTTPTATQLENFDALQDAGGYLGSILKAMLLSSLSNKRSISQGENDIGACMHALSSCPLGSVGCHVILQALIGVLEWCEVLPKGTANDPNEHQKSPFPDDAYYEEAKRLMATRLARNLMMGQFHDVVAPMLLSRTVFAGDRSVPAPVVSTSGDNEEQPMLSWQHHWRWVLLIFSWCASVAGPDGIIAAQSSGSLLLASGLAGSLKGALQSMRLNYITTLFLPTITSSGVNETTYTELLAERLQVMMPLLPGMVVSLLSHPSDANADTIIPPKAMEVVAELLTAVGAAFARIFSQWHMAVANVPTKLSLDNVVSGGSSRRQASAQVVNQIVQTAKTFVPSLLVVTMLIENHIQLRTKGDENAFKPTTMLRAEVTNEFEQRHDDKSRKSDPNSWVEVSKVVQQLSSDSLMSNPSNDASESNLDEKQILMNRLRACQSSVMGTLTDLISVSMRLGGGEASTSFWRTILGTLKESVAYAANAHIEELNDGKQDQPTTKVEYQVERKSHAESLAQGILCRASALVLQKSLKRDAQYDVWSSDLAAAVSKLCILIEEKGLFMRLLGPVSAKFGERSYSADQIMLLGMLLDVLAYGRDVMGWCQIILPNPLDPDSAGVPKSESVDFADDARRQSGIFMAGKTKAPMGNSKLMLQILQPCLRIVVGCVGNITTVTNVLLPRPFITDGGMSPAEKAGYSIVDCSLLKHTLEELKHSLTASIVGLSFPNARDVCMHALASLRRAVLRHQHRNDGDGVKLCSDLLCAVAEEMRVRYAGERRRREAALFDAYEESDGTKHKSKEAAVASQAVEKLMLGGDLIIGAYQGSAISKSSDEDDHEKPKASKKNVDKEEIQEISFAFGSPDTPTAEDDAKPKEGSEKISDDFVMFHEDYQKEGLDGEKKMGWAQYDGFAVALEECSKVVASFKMSGTTVPAEEPECDGGTGNSSASLADTVLKTLSPFLDAFDETVALEAAESEIVELFDANLRMDPKAAFYGGPLLSPQLAMSGTETAADAMTSFIEFAASEKSRLAEISASFLPGHRCSRLAYTERLCWARYIELASDEDDFSMAKFWERGINDGNRDVRSRLVTMPSAPQFKRYIPKYLDHGAEESEEEDVEEEETSDHFDELEGLSELPTFDSNNRFSGGSAISGGSGSRRSTMPPMEAGMMFRRSSKRPIRRTVTGRRKTEIITDLHDSELDLDFEFEEFSKTLSQATGGHIVDITKKKVVEDDGQPDVVLPSDGDGPDEEFDTVHERDFSTSKLLDDDQSKGSKTTQSTESDSTSLDVSVREGGHESFMKSVSATKAGAAHYNITSSAFASPPDNSSSSLSIMHSAAAALIEQYMDNCLHVKAEGTRKCTMLLTSMHLILEYDMEEEGFFEGEVMAAQEEADRLHRLSEDAGGAASKDQEMDRKVLGQCQRRNREDASLRPKSIRWNLSEVSHIYLRRYRLRDSSLELFFIPSGGTAFGGYGLYSPLTSLFLDFGPGHEGLTRRDDAAFAIMKRTPPQTIKQWPDRSDQFIHEQLTRLTIGWAEGRITNFDYLLHLNMLSGRSYNDICQYPVMPWVLANYKDDEVPDLNDPNNFRDLSKPVGALNPNRLQDFIERFNTFADPFIPPFMYGSHYSTSAGVVLHFLVRMHPFAGLHRQLQSGHFDVADRLFSSIPRTWDMCTGSSAAEVKELTPEFYCNPSFLKNNSNFKLGTSQDGDVLGDVVLPRWADNSPEKFVEVMRSALESEICSLMLPDWIDLIFGRKQQGPEAVKAHNVFFYLTYYGSVDVANIEDEALRQATELQIAHFGQCPMQLFSRPHIRRLPQESRFRKLSFYQLLSTYTQGVKSAEEKRAVRNADARIMQMTEPAFLAFFSAPISHWVHLDAPPPGPHAPLISVRLAGTDRCVAIDRQGIFHCFRWAWKSEEIPEEDRVINPTDRGCFVAQRELPRFRSVPRLLHFNMTDNVPPVAISKTLFAGGSVLLVLSDGDGHGGLGMQLLDPAKGTVRGEAVVPSIHSARITCIAADPIGSAAGHGGVGGELAVVGSADGNASLWRFMSSHYLPLRPRVRLQGHRGSKICAVALSSAIQLVASTSRDRCCLFSIGNGSLLRSIKPPDDTLDFMGKMGGDVTVATIFADTPALAISVQGYVVTVCETTIESKDSAPRTVITLHLFTVEGVSLGSKALEKWRGTPHRMSCTPDGTAVLVCSGRGITIHRLSALAPLEFLDEWQITENEDLTSDKIAHAWDIDLGPNLSRPVVAAAACSEGVLRLHALPGISPWSDRHRKSNITQSVGNALAKPAQRLKNAMVGGLGYGAKAVTVGQEIGKEVAADVKQQGGIGGFFSRGLFGKRDSGGK